MTTTKDNLALVVLCSTLGYQSKDDETAIKPLSVAAFNKLESRLNTAGLTPSVFFTEKLSDISGRLSLSEVEVKHIEQLLLRTEKLAEELERLAEKKIFVVG